jgi:hypothetical protein
MLEVSANIGEAIGAIISLGFRCGRSLDRKRQGSMEKKACTSQSVKIDWEELASRLGLLAADGESSGSDAARRALELILGEDALRASVDHYLAHRRGSALARSVLWQLRPWSAMSYCYEIFKGPHPIKTRRTAVELLRAVADRRPLPWVSEFLADEDADIQAWGAGVLDQLLWCELIEPEESEDLLRTAEQHENELVRKRAEFIRGFLHTCAERDEPREPNIP